MYKVAWLARYTKDKTKQEASDYWAGSHGPAMKKVLPLAGYVQSHVTGALPLVTGVAEEETFFDGYSCAWWNSEGRLRAGDDDPGVAGRRRRRRQRLRHGLALEHERPARGEHGHRGAEQPVQGRLGGALQAGNDTRGGPRVLGGTHGPIFKELDIDRYVQNHVVGPIGAEGETGDAEIGFDGFSECWFKDEQQFLDAVESDTWAVAVEDGLKVFDMSQLWGAVLRENVVVAPPVPATR